VFPVRDELYVCVPYGSHSKQRLFPQTSSTGWAAYWRRNLFPVRYELNYLNRNHWVSGLDIKDIVSESGSVFGFG
jgi:hypothetical protein